MHMNIYIYIYIYVYIFIHRHVFCPAQDSSVWLRLTSREQLMIDCYRLLVIVFTLQLNFVIIVFNILLLIHYWSVIC